MNLVFVSKVVRQLRGRFCQIGEPSEREDAAFRRPGRRATAEQVEAVVAEVLGQEARAFERQRKGGWERALLAKALVEQAGMTQREAARVMGLKTGAAVCIQLRRLQEALPKEATLRRQVRAIESQLLSHELSIESLQA